MRKSNLRLTTAPAETVQPEAVRRMAEASEILQAIAQRIESREKILRSLPDLHLLGQ